MRVASYLGAALVADLPPVALIPKHLAARGRQLYFEKYACHSCHQLGEKGGAVGPVLTAAAKRLSPEWLFHYLRDSRRLVGDVPEPALKLPEEEARVLEQDVFYVVGHVTSPKRTISL